MLNKVILMGRLTADPELRHTQNNTPVASFTLAVNRNFGNRDETDFIDIVSWNKNAEFVTNWFHKGQLVAVVGRLQVRNWQDKDGNSRRAYEVVAEETHFAESKRDSTGNAGSGSRNGNSFRSDFSAPAPKPVVPVDPSGFSDLSEDDDELPF